MAAARSSGSKKKKNISPSSNRSVSSRTHTRTRTRVPTPTLTRTPSLRSKSSLSSVSNIPSSLLKKLKAIRLLALDVDGILTDCRTFLDSDGEWKRFFSIRDGYGLMRLKQAGYQVAIITGSQAKDIEARAKMLKIDHVFSGHLDKKPQFEKLQAATGFKSHQIAYMGDDHFDIPVLESCGFSATVSDAMEEVLEISDYVAARPAGNGAVREVCELILKFGALK